MRSNKKRVLATLLIMSFVAACRAQATRVPEYDSLGPLPDARQTRYVGPLPEKNWTQQAASSNVGVLACVSTDCKELESAPFGTGTHSKLVEAASRCSDPLIRAVYWQDYFHQFESRAHFDNCAFNESVDYVEELLRAVESHSRLSNQMNVDKVMFTLGQALHAVQDFYAHSDYVERMEGRYERFREVPILAFWSVEGRAELQRLRQQGLSSGEVWWGWPKRCPDKAPTHGVMSKDHADSGRGAESTRWMYWSRFEAARRLAQEASERFLRDAFSRWPAIAQACGSGLVYVVSEDVRGEPPAK